MTRFFPRSVLVLSLILFSGCTTEQMSRGIYEGGRAYEKSVQSTPLEKSKSELPSYDQYERERRGAER